MGEQSDSIQMSTRQEPVDAVFVLGIVTLALVLITWVVLYVMEAGRTRQATQYETKVNDLNTKIITLKDTEQTYLALNTVVTQAKKLRDTHYTFGPTWTLLTNNVPKDVQFNSLTMGSDSVFRITGVTKSITAVAQFSRQLEKQPGFSTVVPLSIEKQSNTTLYNFSLSFKMNPQINKATP